MAYGAFFENVFERDGSDDGGNNNGRRNYHRTLERGGNRLFHYYRVYCDYISSGCIRCVLDTRTFFRTENRKRLPRSRGISTLFYFVDYRNLSNKPLRRNISVSVLNRRKLVEQQMSPENLRLPIS